MDEDIFKDLEKDLEKRRKEEREREKKVLDIQVEKYKYQEPKSMSPAFTERKLFIAIILILSLYIAYDHLLIHPKTSEKTEDKFVGNVVDVKPESKETKAAQAMQNATNGTAQTTAVGTLSIANNTNATNTTAETAAQPAPEKPKLSGSISLTIDEINKEKVSDTRGYISSVVFTIENGKEQTIIPIVNVYAYDSKNQKEMMGFSRGKFNGDKKIQIAAGEKRTEELVLSPKSFVDLDLPKAVMLTLSYSDKEPLISIKTEVVIS